MILNIACVWVRQWHGVYGIQKAIEVYACVYNCVLFAKVLGIDLAFVMPDKIDLNASMIKQ